MIGNYSDLPYQYVLEALNHCTKTEQNNLHKAEAPIALLSSLIANSNRDPKKKKEPYRIDDFYLYQPKEEMNIPTAVYGAAGMELIKMKKLPPWALFVFKDIKQSASGAPPAMLALIGENALVLAPIFKDKTVKGMLICNEKAYGTEIAMVSPCGKTATLAIPVMSGRYIAVENIELELR